MEILDVLIIGAGLSGIDAAYRIQTQCPRKSFALLEARGRVGGTWDLFRYPGLRSDSDAETLGFPFQPWPHAKSIADGAAIRDYIEETARSYGIHQRIRFGWRASDATWADDEALWTVSCTDGSGSARIIKCRFLYSCAGYYSYEECHQPQWPGMDRFKGRLIQPQFWPADFDPRDRDIVVIGSGATAITLVPSLAAAAKRVTMLQRSPSYVVSRPSVDSMATAMKAVLPAALARRLVRLKNILFGIFVYQYARRRPAATRATIRKLAARQLPASIDVDKHFNPRYQPWDQRLCLASDGDLFKALRAGRAHVETDEIAAFEESGIRLRSGKFLPADTVVSATGLKLRLLGGMKLYRGATPIDLSERFAYKGVLLSDVPNFAMAIGYTNASWTLKCDLGARFVSRLLSYMDKHRVDVVCPTPQATITPESLISLTSGYIQRSESALPKQGKTLPWRLYQNYFLDWLMLAMLPVRDRHLRFVRVAVRTDSSRES